MSKNIPKTSAIENTVMGKIKSGQTQMRPKSYYVSISALMVAAVVLLSFITVYLTSVVSFWLRIMVADGPAYGAKRNLTASIDAFPWWAIILGATSIVGIIYLVKKYGHLYKIRAVYSVIIFIAFFAIVGFALSYSPLPELFNNNHRINMACSSDDINCTINNGMYGRGR